MRATTDIKELEQGQVKRNVIEMTKIETNRIMEISAGLVSPIMVYVGFLNIDFQCMKTDNRYEVESNRGYNFYGIYVSLFCL